MPVVHHELGHPVLDLLDHIISTQSLEILMFLLVVVAEFYLVELLAAHQVNVVALFEMLIDIIKSQKGFFGPTILNVPS